MSRGRAGGPGPNPGARGSDAAVPGDGRPEVLYVMGYGRSGSTLLDILLDNAAEVTGVGELAHYWRWLEEGLSCACGASLPNCPLWGGIVRDHLDSLPHDDLRRWRDVQVEVEHRRRLPRLLGGRLPRELVDRYRQATGTLLDAIVREAGARTLVDSSGSGADKAGRPYALDRHTEADVRVIHLVRDGRAVAWSAMKGPGSPEWPRVSLPGPLTALRTGAAWSAANLAGEWIARRLGPARVLRVRYEDLATHPAVELRRIGAFAGLDLDDLIRDVEAGEDLAVGHPVAGNRMRFRDEIRIRPDFGWREGMPAPLRWLLSAQLWPLLLRYGYLASGETRRAGEVPASEESRT